MEFSQEPLEEITQKLILEQTVRDYLHILKQGKLKLGISTTIKLIGIKERSPSKPKIPKPIRPERHQSYRKLWGFWKIIEELVPSLFSHQQGVVKLASTMTSANCSRRFWIRLVMKIWDGIISGILVQAGWSRPEQESRRWWNTLARLHLLWRTVILTFIWNTKKKSSIEWLKYS